MMGKEELIDRAYAQGCEDMRRSCLDAMEAVGVSSSEIQRFRDMTPPRPPTEETLQWIKDGRR